MKQDARPIEVAQVHLAEHLLWDAAVHRDRKRLWCEVIERYFLPQREAEAVCEDGQHLVRRVMVDSHEVGVHAERAQKCGVDVAHRGHRTPARCAVLNRQLLLLVYRHAVECDRVAVKQDPGAVESTFTWRRPKLVYRSSTGLSST